MFCWLRKIVFLIVLLCPAIADARMQKHNGLSIKLSSPVFKPGSKENNKISCSVNKFLLKGKITGFAFYAMNDVRNVPMELTLEGKPLIYNSTAKGDEIIVFTAQLKDLFYTDTAGNRYKWKWHARAKAPASPIADIAGQKLKQVKCWFTTQVNKQNYSSDTVSIFIQ